MSQKSPLNDLMRYLFHRECVRRNSEYGRQYAEVQAIPPDACVEYPPSFNRKYGETRLGIPSDVCTWAKDDLRTEWSLGVTDHLPDPKERPALPHGNSRATMQDLRPLIADSPFASGARKPFTLVTGDALEFNYTAKVLRLLENLSPWVTRELPGFLVLFYVPEDAKRKGDAAAIDLRRPKLEIEEGVRSLLAALDVRRLAGPEARPRRAAPFIPLQNGFTYLYVYDLRNNGLSFKEIGKQLWPGNDDDRGKAKAQKYYQKAEGLIKSLPYREAITDRLRKREDGRVSGVRCYPMVGDNPSWLPWCLPRSPGSPPRRAPAL